MKSQNLHTGKIAENLALQFLLTSNFELLARNFRTKFGEIDLIMRAGPTIVFVEVKSKIGLKLGPPEDMFTRGKYTKVRRMATVFLNGRETDCRIDLVAIVLNPDLTAKDIRHYPNIYYL